MPQLLRRTSLGRPRPRRESTRTSAVEVCSVAAHVDRGQGLLRLAGVLHCGRSIGANFGIDGIEIDGAVEVHAGTFVLTQPEGDQRIGLLDGCIVAVQFQGPLRGKAGLFQSRWIGIGPEAAEARPIASHA